MMCLMWRAEKTECRERWNRLIRTFSKKYYKKRWNSTQFESSVCCSPFSVTDIDDNGTNSDNIQTELADKPDGGVGHVESLTRKISLISSVSIWYCVSHIRTANHKCCAWFASGLESISTKSETTATNLRWLSFVVSVVSVVFVVFFSVFDVCSVVEANKKMKSICVVFGVILAVQVSFYRNDNTKYETKTTKQK